MMRKREATTSPVWKTGRPRRPSRRPTRGAGRVVIGPARRRGRCDTASSWRRSRRWIAEMGVDARDHLLRLDGLRDEIHRAGFEPAHLVLRVVERGQEDHRGVAGFGIVLEAAAGLVAVDARHDDVEQDDQRSARGARPSAPLRHCGRRRAGSSGPRASRAGRPGSWHRHRPGGSGRPPPRGLV